MTAQCMHMQHENVENKIAEYFNIDHDGDMCNHMPWSCKFEWGLKP